MKKLTAFLLLSLFSVTLAKACANYYYAISREGEFSPMGYTWLYPFQKNFNQKLNVNKLLKLETKLKEQKNFMLLSDYSVGLMKLGKSTEALVILKELYKHYPNEYIIASNLGTAYELNGLNDSALKYIKRTIQLNPNDHEGSEWIHVKILEAKLQMATNTSYLLKHKVLNLSAEQLKNKETLKHLLIQLQERVPFSPAPNELMGLLFEETGDVSANVESIEYARAYYQIAQKYYGSKSPLLDGKIKEMEKLMTKYSNKRPDPKMDTARDQFFEGAFTRIGYFRYTELLKDNSDNAYKINWEKVNTNPETLLAMADLKLTPEQAINTSVTAGDTLVAEHKHTEPTKEEAMDANTSSAGTGNVQWNIGIAMSLGLLVIIGGTLLFTGRKRK